MGDNLLRLLQTPHPSSSSSSSSSTPSSPLYPPNKLVKIALPGADIPIFVNFLTHEEGDALFYTLEGLRKRQKQFLSIGHKREILQWSVPGSRRYRFSGEEFVAAEFLPFVKSMSRKIESILPKAMLPADLKEVDYFNYCLANFYADGSAGVAWHTDDEPELVDLSPIACVSVGDQRVFALRNKFCENDELRITLPHGSVLVMAGMTQKNYVHSILKESKKKFRGRYSLTFRCHH